MSRGIPEASHGSCDGHRRRIVQERQSAPLARSRRSLPPTTLPEMQADLKSTFLVHHGAHLPWLRIDDDLPRYTRGATEGEPE
ncbi:hypothetical protein [Tropicimonas sp. IMCC6043]|uniref:hypothetical protein n=1 Tax=Tropicimonas sp. IMCC6043 TaxID=2510645 RepID=UPI00101BB9EE|nr:hypothetical protein [Tropicimonas sp. IMCC6043]RYH11643.1 hypothetical protein EU800_03105 [Tropicimonas sp. IMCC6043]